MLKKILHVLPHSKGELKPSMLDGSDSVLVINGTGRSSNKDEDADFAAKHMPDDGHDIKDFKVFTWKIHDWKQDETLHSPKFECAGLKWHLILKLNDTSTHLSLFLATAESPDVLIAQNECVEAMFLATNVEDPSIYAIGPTFQHRYTGKDDDWGFHRFYLLKDLLKPEEGQSKAVVEGNSMQIKAYVRLINDPTGVLWHSFEGYDFKKETGSVGLLNQGATSYMNAVLQVMFHTLALRKAVYQIPIEGLQPSENLVLALQRLFYHLETSPQAVETKELTNAFGWKAADVSHPQDPLEFYHTLCDTLASLIKGTSVEGVIESLFSTEVKSYKKCLSVDYESFSVERTRVMAFHTTGMKDILDSLRHYTTTQKITDYDAGEFGHQEAETGSAFHSFPPYLVVHLSCSAYNQETGQTEVDTSRYEYPAELDLGDFLPTDADRSMSWIYCLYAVIAYTGDLEEGQYTAFIRTGPEKERWFKFDDNKVIPVQENNVFEDNYGGFLQLPEKKNKSSKASMLLYARKTAEQILQPLLEESIPAPLKKIMNDESIFEEGKKPARRQADRNTHMNIKVVTNRAFINYEGFDIANFDTIQWPISDLVTFRVAKDEVYPDFKRRVADHFNYPPSDLRFWALIGRQNKTCRIYDQINDNSNLSVEGIRTEDKARGKELRLYLQVLDNSSKSDAQSEPCLIFLKHFDQTKQSLLGIGAVSVARKHKISTLCATICRLMRWNSDTTLNLYEEIKPGMIEQLKQSMTYAQGELITGDIVCFQRSLSVQDAQALKDRGLHVNAPDFYAGLAQQVVCTFVDSTNHSSKFDLVISKDDSYEAMAQKVGERLLHDPMKLLFTSTQGVAGRPNLVLQRSTKQTIGNMLPSIKSNLKPVILYEKLEVNIVELEMERSIDVVWMGFCNKRLSIHSIQVKKVDNVARMKDQLGRLVASSAVTVHPNKLRVFRISLDGRKQDELSDSDFAYTIPESDSIYAEAFSDQPKYLTGEKLIDVFHFSGDLSNTHGVPFKFNAKRGEAFAQTKKRLQDRIGRNNVPDDRFVKYRFALPVAEFKQPIYLTDDDVIYTTQFVPTVLGMDHPKEHNVVMRS